MITINKVRTLIRRKIKDVNEVAYSDFEILDAINECIGYLNIYLIQFNSEFLERTQEYKGEWIDTEETTDENGFVVEVQVNKTLQVDGDELPQGYITLISLARKSDNYHLKAIPSVENIIDNNTYKVVNGKIFAMSDCVMLYNKELQIIKGLDGEDDYIELPTLFNDFIVKIAVMILSQNASGDVLMQSVEDLVRKLIPIRKYSNTKIKMPWKV